MEKQARKKQVLELKKNIISIKYGTTVDKFKISKEVQNMC